MATNLHHTIGSDKGSSEKSKVDYDMAAISEDGTSNGGPGEKTVRPHGSSDTKAHNHGPKKEPSDWHDANEAPKENYSIVE